MTDKAIFEIRLDTQSCYVTQCSSTIIKSRYLKPIFKSERSILDIWGAIIFGKKGLIHFLGKKSWIISKIYFDQVFQLLEVLFYREYLKEIREKIYIDDSTRYQIYKYTKKFNAVIKFLYMI